jgi:hypothetical protein
MDSEPPQHPPEARALAWFESKWTQNKSCPICASNTWQMGAVADLHQREGNLAYPLLPLVCLNCGFVHLFSAIITGVHPISPPPASEAAPEPTEGDTSQ